MINLSQFEIITTSLILRLTAAIIILLIGFIIGRFVNKLLKKVLKELETDRILKEQASVKIPVEEFLSSTAKYLVYFIAIIMALNQLGITTVILQILLFVALVILVAFIILAVKDFIPNVLAGFFIYQKKVLKEGDKIKVNKIEGKVIHVNLVETRIKTKSNDIVHIPNSVLTKNILIKKKR